MDKTKLKITMRVSIAILLVASAGLFAGYIMGDENCCERHGGVMDGLTCKNLKYIAIPSTEDIFVPGKILNLTPVEE